MENCIACRFHQEIDQGAQNALAFCPLKTRNTVQSKRLPLVDSLFIISEVFLFVKNFFKTFFRSFWSISFKTQTFLTAVSFETAYLVYQTQNHLSRTFFILFKSFSVRPPCLSATALIGYHGSAWLSTTIFFRELGGECVPQRLFAQAGLLHFTRSACTQNHLPRHTL